MSRLKHPVPGGGCHQSKGMQPKDFLGEPKVSSLERTLLQYSHGEIDGEFGDSTITLLQYSHGETVFPW